MSWAEVSKINSDFTTSLDTTLGKKTDAAGVASTSSMFAWIKSIYNFTTANVSPGVVKSVQRGVYSGSATGNTAIAITISTVNPNKAFVILNGAMSSYVRQSDVYSHTNQPYLTALTATNFQTLPCCRYVNSSWTAIPFSWQVIEFY